MTSNTEEVILLDLMKSLASAFSASQGLPEVSSSDWGRKVFDALGHLYPRRAGDKKEVYMEASRLLYVFSLRGVDVEFCLNLYHNPEAFLRTVMIVLESSGNGSGNGQGD